MRSALILNGKTVDQVDEGIAAQVYERGFDMARAWAAVAGVSPDCAY